MLSIDLRLFWTLVWKIAIVKQLEFWVIINVLKKHWLSPHHHFNHFWLDFIQSILPRKHCKAWFFLCLLLERVCLFVWCMLGLVNFSDIWMLGVILRTFALETIAQSQTLRLRIFFLKWSLKFEFTRARVDFFRSLPKLTHPNVCVCVLDICSIHDLNAAAFTEWEKYTFSQAFIHSFIRSFTQLLDLTDTIFVSFPF